MRTAQCTIGLTNDSIKLLLKIFQYPGYIVCDEPFVNIGFLFVGPGQGV